VTVDEKIVGKINQGILCLLGVQTKDTPELIEKMAKKVCSIRLWEKNEVSP
jgi:D-tyrosyl-tRNA(Tyr) deacylase